MSSKSKIDSRKSVSSFEAGNTTIRNHRGTIANNGHNQKMTNNNKNINRVQTPKVGSPKKGASFRCLPEEWKSPAKLEQPPKHYPMEATKELYPLVTYALPTILHNIASSLKEMSIQAQFMSIPLSAVLRTQENIEIYLQFWLSNDKQHVIVEIQRLRGCSVKFHYYARVLLEAIHGKVDRVEFKRHSRDGNIRRLKSAETIVNELERHRAITGQHDTTNQDGTDPTKSIRIAQDLIQQDRIDSRYLGWETMCFLTDMESSKSTACTLASRALLFGEAPFQGIRNSLFNILLKHNMGDDYFCKMTEDDYRFSDSDSEDEEDYFMDSSNESVMKVYPHYLVKTVDAIFSLALRAFSNALEVLSDTNAVCVFMHSVNFPDICSILIDQIANASNNPHNAVSSIKSLIHLYRNAPTSSWISEQMYQNSSIIKKANLYGNQSHALLEDESNILLDMIAIATPHHKTCSNNSMLLPHAKSFCCKQHQPSVSHLEHISFRRAKSAS